MEEELLVQHKEEAIQLRGLYGDFTEGVVDQPLLIAMKGQGCAERRHLAFMLAAAIGCPLIQEDDFGLHPHLLCRIADSNLSCGLSVVVDSQLSHRSLFLRLQSLAASHHPAQLFIVECFPGDHQNHQDGSSRTRGSPLWVKPSSLEHLKKLLEQARLSCYGEGQIPKLNVKISPAGYKSSIEYVIHAIFAHPHRDLRLDLSDEGCVCKHVINLYTEMGTNKANPHRCANSGCNFILDKSCSQLPLELNLIYPHLSGIFHLRNGEDDEEGVESRCISCKQVLKGYYYSDEPKGNRLTNLDLDCLLLPTKRRVEFHEHQLQLELLYEDDSACAACGLRNGQGHWYRCQDCSYLVEPYCAWLPKTAVCRTHRHPFELILDPQNDTDNDSYCDFCTEKRDKNRWIYYCKEKCGLAAHPRCLVPTAGPPLFSEADHE